MKTPAAHHISSGRRASALGIAVNATLAAGKIVAGIFGNSYALIACGVIAWNGIQFLRSALDKVMDVSAPPAVIASVRALAGTVEGVVEIEKCRIRKNGLHLAMDIHVLVDGALTVWRGSSPPHLFAPHRTQTQHPD